MKHVRFGGTGLRVSQLCLGTMTFGAQCDEQVSHAILDTAYDAGIDFLDAADVYPSGGGGSVGRTEEIIGTWLKNRRQDVIIATKCVGPMGPKPWDRGMSRKHILDAIDASLSRLQVDYVDLYQLHGFDPTCPMEEALEALTRVVEAGKARYVGVSNWPAHRLARAIGKTELNGYAPISSVQPRYNLLCRPYERDLLPMCREEGIAVIPYNPLAGGLLTGKHSLSSGPAAGTRFDKYANYQGRYWHDEEFSSVDQIQQVAADLGVSMTTLAVAWVMANPAVTAPIIGASKPEQLSDCVAAVELKLDEATRSKLDEICEQWRWIPPDR